MSPKSLVVAGLSLATLGACSGGSEPRERQSSACSNFRLQENSWTPENVRTGISCFLETARPPSPYAKVIAKVPAKQFAETARWMNEQLTPENRAVFFGQLEEFPAELAGIFKEPANAAMILDPVFVRTKNLWEPALRLLAADDAKLFVALQAAHANLQADGPWPLPDELKQSVQLFLAKLPRLKPADRSELLQASMRMLSGVAGSPQIQRSAAALGHEIPCDAKPTETTLAPLPRLIDQLVRYENNPDRFFHLTTQSLVYWQASCRPTGDLSPDNVSAGLQFAIDNFADLALFARLTRENEAYVHSTAMIDAVIAHPTLDGRNALAIMRESGLFAASEAAFARTDLGVEWTEGLTSLDDLTRLSDYLDLPRTNALLGISPQSLKLAVRSVRLLNVDSKLLNEWQALFARVGMPAFTDLAEFVGDGRLREFVATLKEWMGEDTFQPGNGGQDPTPPSTPTIPRRYEGEFLLREMVRSCLSSATSAAGLPAVSACLRQKGGQPDLWFPFFESRSFEDFVHRLTGADPVFDIARGAIDMGWIDENSSYEKFLVKLIDTFRPFRMDIGSLTLEIRNGAELTPAELDHFVASVKTLRVPSMRGKRMERIGLDRRALEPVEGLPANWMSWLRGHFADNLTRGVFLDPETLRVFEMARRVRRSVPVQIVDPDNVVRTVKFDMNGLDMVDLLIWESQVKPFFGWGDKLVMTTVLRDMINLRTTQDVKDWITRMRGLLDGAISFLEFFDWFPPNPTLIQLQNARVILNAIDEFVPPEVILKAAIVTTATLPPNVTIEEQTAAFTLLHRVGLFPTLSHWMESARPTEGLKAGQAPLPAKSAAQLAQGLREFLNFATETDLPKIGYLNVLSDGEMLSAALNLYVRTAKAEQPRPFYWMSRTLAILTVPVFAQMADARVQTPPRDTMSVFFSGMGPILDELTKRLSAPYSAQPIHDFAQFTVARTNDAGGPEGLRKAELVQLLSTPAGRDTMIPWIRSGALRSVLEWMLYMRQNSDSVPVAKRAAAGF